MRHAIHFLYLAISAAAGCAQMPQPAKVANDVLAEAEILEGTYQHWHMSEGATTFAVADITDLLPYLPASGDSVTRHREARRNAVPGAASERQLAAANRLHHSRCKDSLGHEFRLGIVSEGISISPLTITALAPFLRERPDFFGRFDGRRLPPAIITAARQNDVNELQRLLANGADPDQTCVVTNSAGFSFTPLMAAANVGHLEATQVLLDAGADTERRFRHYGGTSHQIGWTALMFAIDCGRIDVCRALLESGAGVGVIPGNNSPHRSPLRLAAVVYTREHITKLLLDHGADPNDILQDHHRLSRMEEEAHKQGILTLLKQYSRSRIGSP